MAASPGPLSKQNAGETSSTHWTQRQPGKEDEVGLVAAPLRSVTLRIMLLGTLLIFINCYWVIEVEDSWTLLHS